MANEKIRKYVGPELKIIRLTGNDVIATSEDYEGELIPPDTSENPED